MEGAAGASRLSPPDADDPTQEVISEAADSAPDPSVASERPPSRIGRGASVAVSATLLLCAAGIATGGYFAFRSNEASQALTRSEDAAVAAAKNCVSALQAPDAAAMAASQQRIFECATGDFRTQATLMVPVMLEAYQAANIQLQVTQMRAGVERHNDDGSIDVLVAAALEVPSNPERTQGVPVRMRVQMQQEDGQYKIGELDMVQS